MLLALWSTASIAPAADWFFQPAVSLGTGYEENVDLVPEDQTDASSYNLGAELRGGRLTERSQLVGSLRAFFQRYPGNERLDTDNLSAALSYGFLLTELDRLSLDLSYDRDTSRTSELTTTGNIGENVPRTAIGMRAAWERRLTERSVGTLEYERSAEGFDNNVSGLVDADQDDINASYSYWLTEKLAIRGTLGATFYNPDLEDDYKGYSASLGMDYAFSQTLAGNLDVGWQRIDSETDLDMGTTTRTESGYVFDLSLSKAFERSSLTLSAGRRAVPTGSGRPLLQESLGVGYGYQFSPRLSVTIPVGVFRNETLDFGDAGEDSDTRIFFATQPTLNWRVTENLVLSAYYRYEHEHLKDADTTAEGNAVFVSLSYIWPTEIPGLSQ